MAKEYSKQLINELAQDVDSALLDFFNNNASRYNFKITSMEKLIEESMNDYLDGDLDSDVVKKAMHNERRNRRNMKKRWYSKLVTVFESFAETDIYNAAHPFASTIAVYMNATNEQRILLYNDKSLPEVLHSQMILSEQWSDDSTKWLIEFPALSSMPDKKIYKAYKSDLFANLYNIIQEKFEGDLNNYLQVYPSMLVENPLFAIKAQNLDVSSQSSAGAFIEDLIFYDGDGGLRTTYSPDGKIDKGVKSLDVKDRKIIQTMVSKTGPDFFTSRTISQPLRVYAKAIAPEGTNLTSFYYDDAVNRIASYPYYTYRILNGKNRVVSDTFNLIDRVTIVNTEDVKVEKGKKEQYKGSARVDVKVGDALYNEIINRQMILITKNNYKSLNNNLAKLMCLALQRERVQIYFGNLLNNDFSQTYDYSYFTKIVRLPTRRKKDNLKYITEALDEFLKNNFIIKSYTYNTTNFKFKIEFYPLTPAEKEDLLLETDTNDEINGQLNLSDISTNL